MHFLAILCLSIIAGSNVANATDNPDGLFLRKTVTTSPDADGNYWLDLEAYVTGSIETVSEYPGLDVVMVLDVSSSLNSSEINTLKKAAADFVTKLKDYKGDAKVSRISEGSAPVELYTIMLTGAKDKEYIEKTICNLDPHFEYNVAETDWSWSYTPEGATSMTTTPTSTNPLTFTNIKNTNTVKNAEAMVENTFDSIRTDASHSRLCNTTSDTAW